MQCRLIVPRLPKANISFVIFQSILGLNVDQTEQGLRFLRRCVHNGCGANPGPCLVGMGLTPLRVKLHEHEVAHSYQLMKHKINFILIYLSYFYCRNNNFCFMICVLLTDKTGQWKSWSLVLMSVSQTQAVGAVLPLTVVSLSSFICQV